LNNAKPLILWCVLFAAASSVAQTEISGPQSGTLGPGTYLVTAEISVQEGDSLTIMPGTTFLHSGNHRWIISGKFTAEGTEADSIVFVPQDTLEIHMWGGLRFQTDAPVATLDYCVIDHCYMSDYNGPSASVSVYGSQGITITHCRISNAACNNDHGAICALNTTVLIDNCLLRDNTAVNHPKGMGVFLDNCTDSEILHTIISGNTSDGA